MKLNTVHIIIGILVIIINGLSILARKSEYVYVTAVMSILLINLLFIIK